MTDEHMKEKLSALVDNELDELEERRVLAALESDTPLRQTWQRYHLARSILQGDLSAAAALDVSEELAKRIAADPSAATIFQPHKAIRFVGTLAIAASVAAIAIVGVQWLYQSPPAPLALVADSKPAPAAIVRAVTTSSDAGDEETVNALNAYLVEHEEFASTPGIGGMMSYVRVVSSDER